MSDEIGDNINSGESIEEWNLKTFLETRRFSYLAKTSLNISAENRMLSIVLTEITILLAYFSILSDSSEKYTSKLAIVSYCVAFVSLVGIIIYIYSGKNKRNISSTYQEYIRSGGGDYFKANRKSFLELSILAVEEALISISYKRIGLVYSALLGLGVVFIVCLTLSFIG